MTKWNKDSALYKALKITIIYLLVGSAWILVTDWLVQIVFSELSRLVFFSAIKGLAYVAVTALLIFWLTYPALKRTLDAREALHQSNLELEASNRQYRDLSREYHQNEVLLKSLIDSIPDLIFYKDDNGVYIGCNAAFAKFVGRPEEEIAGKTDLDLFPAETAALFRRMDSEMFKTSTPRRNEEKVIYPDGTSAILETLKTPYYDLDNRVIGLIGVSRDITERKVREDMIRHLSYHDAVTGVYSRTYFEETLSTMDTFEHLPLSVIIGDVNGLKLINDAFGHKEGDRLLKAIADIMMANARDGDIVTRTGGDEFAMLLPRTNNQEARIVADRIRAACAKKRQEETSQYTDISLGYATKEDPTEDLDKIMTLAEDLMYRRKLLENRSQHNNILTSIKSTMFEKSNETEAHAGRLADHARRLGTELGLLEDKLDELELAATLHDLGKINIDKNILTKPGPLTEEEWAEIRKHPEVGFRIANAISELHHIAEYILGHHEHWDGSGYPLGLSGTDIPLISRIVSVVDAYDAMTQDRAYRKALTPEQARVEILRNAGTQFDPDIARLFVDRILS